MSEDGKDLELTVVNEAILGMVEIYFRHVDGRELAPMQSLKAKIGTNYLAWLADMGYVDRVIEGYELVYTEIPDAPLVIDGLLTVTLWYDDIPSEGIVIPKTGETPPYVTDALALLLWGVAAGCIIAVFKQKAYCTNDKIRIK